MNRKKSTHKSVALKESKNYYAVFSIPQSMEATLTGRSGVHVASPVDKVSKNESDYATTQNQPMGADHAAVPVSIPGNVMLVSVQVQIIFVFVFFKFNNFIACVF